jgi:hypothetical protein
VSRAHPICVFFSRFLPWSVHIECTMTGDVCLCVMISREGQQDLLQYSTSLVPYCKNVSHDCRSDQIHPACPVKSVLISPSFRLAYSKGLNYRRATTPARLLNCLMKFGCISSAQNLSQHAVKWAPNIIFISLCVRTHWCGNWVLLWLMLRDSVLMGRGVAPSTLSCLLCLVCATRVSVSFTAETNSHLSARLAIFPNLSPPLASTVLKFDQWGERVFEQDSNRWVLDRFGLKFTQYAFLICFLFQAESFNLQQWT